MEEPRQGTRKRIRVLMTLIAEFGDLLGGREEVSATYKSQSLCV